MSTKKRFGINPELANGIRSSINTASKNPGQLHYDMMLIGLIETDPNNPRQLSLSLEDLNKEPSSADPQYALKQKQLDDLRELANSISSVGVRNAIEVYKHGDKYRIISGERRYLASVISQQSYVPVRISEKPDDFKLRYLQWIENINRQDLSLYEKYNNLNAMAQAYRATKGQLLTLQDLKTVLGVSNAQAHRYHALMQVDGQALQLIKEGKLNNLQLIQEVMSSKNIEERTKKLAAIENSIEQGASLAQFKSIVSSKKSGGSKAPAINLGKIHQPSTARYIFDLLLSNKQLAPLKSDFEKVNWSSTKSINNAFKKLILAIESEALAGISDE